MKKKKIFHFLLFGTVCLLFLPLLMDSSAQANETADLIGNILDKIPADPFEMWGITGKDVSDVGGAFDCFANASDAMAVVGCVDNLKTTKIGQMLTGESDNALAQAGSAIGIGIPSWFWNLVDLYVAFVQKDYWAIVAILGETSWCAIAQSLTAGQWDVCGVIENLIGLAEDVYGVAEDVLAVFGIDLGAILSDVAGFLSDFAEGAWQSVCQLFGSCDSEGPSVEQLTAIAFLYINNNTSRTVLTDALSRSDQAYTSMLETVCYPIQKYIEPYKGWADAMQNAKTALRPLILNQWNADMVTLVIERNKESSKEYTISSLAKDIWSSYGGISQSPENLIQKVPGQCISFVGNSYRYPLLDRWLVYAESAGPGTGEKKNDPWCQQNFLTSGNRVQFKTLFESKIIEVLKTKCPPSGPSYACPNDSSYQECTIVMSHLGQPASRCQQAVSGRAEAANRVAIYLSHNSLVPFTKNTYNHYGQDGQPPQSDDITCTRPVQQTGCTDYYNSQYKNVPAPPYVVCSLQEDSAYTTKRLAVAAFVARINQKYGGTPLKIKSDPLLIHFDKIVHGSGPVLMQQVQNEKENDQVEAEIRQSANPSFQISTSSVNWSFDGLSQPTAEIITTVKDSPKPQGVQSPGIDKSLVGQMGQLQLKERLEKGSAGFTQFVTNPDDRGKVELGGLAGSTGGLLTGGPGLGTGPGVKTGDGIIITGPGTPGGPDPREMGQITGRERMTGPGPEMKLGGLVDNKREAVTMPEMKNLEGMAEKRFEAVTAPDANKKVEGSQMQALKTVDSQSAMVSGPGAAPSTGQTGAATPMMGSLPPGSPLPGGPPLPPSSGALSEMKATKDGPSPLPSLPPPPLADLAAWGAVRLGGNTVNWNGSITIDAGQAASRNKNNSGLCEFVVEYGLTNLGGTKAGTFRTLWTNTAVGGSWPRQWISLDPGSTRNESEIIPFKPGSNVLQLIIDDQQQIQELNKGNNQLRVIVNVTGLCGAAPAVTTPSPQSVSPPQSAPPPQTVPPPSSGGAGAPKGSGGPAIQPGAPKPLKK